MIQSWASIKIPEISIDSLSLSLWWPILDIPVKIQDVIQGAKITVESLIIFDGISLRKLHIRDARNMLTMTWVWKLSVQWKENTVSSVSGDARDIALDVGWVWFIKPAYKILRFWARKLGFLWNSDDESSFHAILSHRKEKLWTSDFSIKKWHKYKLQWDESDFSLESQECLWKCVLRVTTILQFKEIQGERLVSRTNIPLFWLNRDHARPVSIRVITQVIPNDIHEERIFDTTLILWPIKYRTIVSGE